MLNMLEELYCGNVGFDSGFHSPDSPFSKAARKRYDCMQKLTATLNETEKELFTQYREAQGTIDSITRYNIYQESLTFGVLFMIEIFMNIGYGKKEEPADDSD